MIIEIKIPTPGESITEVVLTNWLVEDGAFVEKDQELAEIESDKATLPILAEKSGKLKIILEGGTTVRVGTIACEIDTSFEGKKTNPIEKATTKEKSTVAKELPVEQKEEPKINEPKIPIDKTEYPDAKATPLAKNMLEEQGLSIDDFINGIKKISTKEVKQLLENKSHSIPVSSSPEISRAEKREKMSSLRKKLSTRLVSVKNETAMLTTFNEIDMSRVMELRTKYQQKFVDKHGVKLGFMSFFTKAATEALRAFPKVNSMLDGDEIIHPGYVDIAFAVQTDKGLMVPVLRNTETMSLADIEKNIMDLAAKARKFRLSIDEMTGGTFTITNGGVFGSMLSTPIINPPQSGILGMHNVVERPVAINGSVQVRPIMYVALSYDHRIIDGRDSVSFLVKVKELIESPEKLLFGTSNPEMLLLGL